MTRRDAAWLFASAAGLATTQEFLAGWLRAAENHAGGDESSAPPEPDRWSSYEPHFFSADEFRTLQTFMAIVIPSDETPGAREAHTADFCDFFVNAAAEYAPEVQQDWREAMRYLEEQKFASLSHAEQVAFIHRISEPERNKAAAHAGFEPYRLIKDMTVHAFYTSRVGLIDVLQYKGNAYLTEFPGCTHPEHHRV